jgi:hypothetical protein
MQFLGDRDEVTKSAEFHGGDGRLAAVAGHRPTEGTWCYLGGRTG